MIDPIPQRPLKEVTTTADLSKIKDAVSSLSSPSSVTKMEAANKVLTEAPDKDLGDVIADFIDVVIPFFTGQKAKIVLSVISKFIRTIL